MPQVTRYNDEDPAWGLCVIDYGLGSSPLVYRAASSNTAYS